MAIKGSGLKFCSHPVIEYNPRYGIETGILERGARSAKQANKPNKRATELLLFSPASVSWGGGQGPLRPPGTPLRSTVSQACCTR